MNKSQKYSLLDTIPDIAYTRQELDDREPAILVNGHLVDMTITEGLDGQNIESIKVLKDSVQFENTKYYGQIMIDTKSSYNPKIISLENLVFKYTNLTTNPDLIILDDKIICDKFGKRYVDEKYILKIIVQELRNDENHNHYVIIKLITRTEENVKEANKIIIRGNDFKL